MATPKVINPKNLYSPEFLKQVKKYFPDVPQHVLETGGGTLVSYMRNNACNPVFLKLIQTATSLHELKSQVETFQANLVPGSRHIGITNRILNATSLADLQVWAKSEQARHDLIAEYQLNYSHR